MKKSLFKKFAVYQGLTNLDNVTNRDDVSKIDDVSYPLKNVIEEIFSVDPVSGLPKGDIQYYLSKDGNPEVKAWLESNLLQPRRQSSSVPEGVTDELIAEFARQPNESRADYAERLVNLRIEAEKNYKDLIAKQNENKSE